MALFTDTGVVTIDDLGVRESGLVNIASSHGINVDTKIALATAAIGDELLYWLLRGSNDPQRFRRHSLGLSTVVVTPVLKRWICFDALARFFAEAYNVQLNTRFQGKWTEYQNEATAASSMTFRSGLGMVVDPLPRPLMPLISVQDGQAPIGSLFVQTTWVNSLGHESAPSPINGQILSGAAGVVIAMAEGAANAPLHASGWNVYASTSDAQLLLQNVAPLAIGTSWELPESGLTEGVIASSGQVPEFYVEFSRQIQRG